MSQQTRKPKAKAGTHPFVLDTDLGAGMDGRGVCATCHLVGTPDDARHRLPDVPEQAAHLRRYEPQGD